LSRAGPVNRGGVAASRRARSASVGGHYRALPKAWRFILFSAMHFSELHDLFGSITALQFGHPLTKGVFFIFMRGFRAAFFYGLFIKLL
jgi:hypothetical protein